MSSYAVISGQPKSIKGQSPDVLAVVLVDGDKYTCISPDDEWVDTVADLADNLAFYEIEGEDALLRHLTRGLSYYSVAGPISFEGDLDEAEPIIERLYFG